MNQEHICLVLEDIIAQIKSGSIQVHHYYYDTEDPQHSSLELSFKQQMTAKQKGQVLPVVEVDMPPRKSRKKKL